jgi:hypothetical protein
VHAPVHTRKSADYSVPRKTRAPHHRHTPLGLVHAMDHAVGFIFSLACKSTEQCYSMRTPRTSHSTVWGRCELLQARVQGASRSCWLVMQAVILRPPLVQGRAPQRLLCYMHVSLLCTINSSTLCVLDDSYELHTVLRALLQLQLPRQAHPGTHGP